MRVALSVVLCAVLLAGANAVIPVTSEAGEYYVFSVLALGGIERCRLRDPAGVTRDFTEASPIPHGDKFEMQPITSMPFCAVKVQNLQAADSGLWEVSSVGPDGTGSSQAYQLTVRVDEEESDAESQEPELIGENAHWFNVIDFPTRTDQIIDISLPRIDQEEECIIRTPNKTFIEASKADRPDLKVHNRSYFVSCRVTIGPMVEDLIGEWAICGKYTENNNEHVRCQPAKIYWNSQNNPASDWHPNVQPKFDHPVHFDSTLTPAVTGYGHVVTCHIITPDGEDLAVTKDSTYPSITVTQDHSICTFAIGPIHQDLLGDWVIYGLFSNLIQGLNEERLPFHMFLYDEEKPSNQAYNVTILDPLTRAVNMGNTFTMEVSVEAGQVDGCYFRTPSGNLYKMGEDINFQEAAFDKENGEGIVCRVLAGPITEEFLGDWTVIGKFSNNGMFTELQRTFQLVLEDPENPIHEDRKVIYLTNQTVNTEMSKSERLVIPSHEFINRESCHIRTPNGLQYQIMKGFSAVPGVEVIEEEGVECGVIITVVSEDVIGDWILIARANHHSEPIERRLPITIYVTESVEALQTAITLNEGEDLYVSLKHPTAYYETCKLIGPFGFECQAAVRDPERTETCGFIRRDITSAQNGTWTITFGVKMAYEAKIAVIVNPENSDISAPGSTTTTLNLVRDRPAEQDVGPEDAVYCKLEDPQGLTVYDSFGRCHLSLDKVGMEHQGYWKMIVASPGRILADEHELFVNVRESEGKTPVVTNVLTEKPLVSISCSVQTDEEITGCKFRNPQGHILIAAKGVEEDRFTFYGKGASIENGVSSYECGIRINDPATAELGLWRCALETADETYYGHVPVLCPYALQVPAIAAVVQQEPILKSHRSLISAVEDVPTVMSCSVEAHIRYCYFRFSNGTTISVAPGMSSPSMEYVGAGLDAGECGIRFHGMAPKDSGRWSCHVGLYDSTEEQSEQFQVNIQERMTVNHYIADHTNRMTVEGIVYDNRALEYCRFVRIDGFGFTSENVPSQYTLTGLLGNGECIFTSSNPTILDMHPWTIAARIRGQDVEISKDTMESVVISPPNPEPVPEPEQGPIHPEHIPEQVVIYNNNAFVIVLSVFLTVLCVALIFGGVLLFKWNNKRTVQRAPEVSVRRRSFSNSIPKDFYEQSAAPAYSP